MLGSASVLRRIAFASISLGAVATARANPAGIVPAAGGVFATIDYQYEQDSSTITREYLDAGTDPSAPLPTHRDFAFHQYKHTITPKVEIGILPGVWLSADLPIVINQTRELRLGTDVGRDTSPTVAGGLLPAGGFDARDPSTATTGDLMFRGPDRHGIDQVSFGFGVAPMSQADDDTKPTWKMGADFKLAVGKVMRFDREDPNSSTGVGSGVHELKLWTSFDRKLGWAEPWAQFFWQVPVGVTSSSLFQNPGFGADNVQKGQQAGASFGLEAYAIDDGDHNRVSLELSGRVVAHFEGRDYSEMWEVFAYAGDASVSGNPLVLDSDPTSAGVQALSHPGITNIENYIETSARVALRAQLGPHVRFAALGDLVWKSDHIITFADAGIDRNGDDLINAGTAEVNPLHSDAIDMVGYRYHSIENLGIVIGIQGEVLF
jgi:hypothetical protein